MADAIGIAVCFLIIGWGGYYLFGLIFDEAPEDEWPTYWPPTSPFRNRSSTTTNAK